MAAGTEFVADLTNYKDRVGARIPEGTYTFRIAEADLEKARSGNQMIVLSLEVVSGPHAGETVVDRLVLSATAIFRLVGFLKALGIPTPKKRLKLDTKRFINRRIQAEVADGEPYRNSIKSEVVSYSRAEQVQADSDDLEDLDDVEELEDLTDDSVEDLEDIEEVEEVEEKPKAKKKAKKRAAPVEVEEEDDDFDEEIDLDDLTI